MFVLAASIVFIMYNIINLPFISVVHNYRANLMHVTHLVILFTANYYRSMKSNTPLPQKSHIHTPAIVMLIFVTISVIFSILVIFYEIFMKVKELAKKCKSNSVENANELTN